MIRKGEDWGAPMALPAKAPVFGNDRALARAYTATLTSQQRPSFDELADLAASVGEKAVFGLTGGDLHRTLGSPSRTAQELVAGTGIGFEMDVGLVELLEPSRGHGLEPAGTESVGQVSVGRVFVAHMEARTGRSRFAGLTVIAMNAAFIGGDNLGPRAHPGDGLIDLTMGQLGLWDRLRATRRQRVGTHLPHPDLQERRRRLHDVGELIPGEPAEQAEMTVVCDGEPLGRRRLGRVACVPAAMTVVV